MESNIKKLIKVVMDKSESKEWENAKKEWFVYSLMEDDSLETSCVCGKPELRYVYTIKNSINGNTLSPIGSTCIKKFNRPDLNDTVDVYEQILRLMQAEKDHVFIELKSGLFSRKLLLYLFKHGAFDGSPKYPAIENYNFILDQFNSRTPPTDNVHKKIKAIIMNYVKPYARKLIDNQFKSN